MTISLTSPNSSTASIQKNGGDVITFDANNNATFAGNIVTTGTVVSGSAMGMRNRIINGDMRIDQRNAGASVTPTATGFNLDRWSLEISQASKLSVQQNAGSVTPPAGFVNYLGITTVSAYTPSASESFNIRTFIEGYNTADLNWGAANAKTVTLSFQVYSSLTGTFGGALRNDGNNRSYPFTYSIPAANTWTTISITIAGDTTGTWNTTNQRGIAVIFGLGVGSTNSGTAGAWAAANYQSATGATSVVGTNGATWYITGVQLEVGSTATPFERRLYGNELQLCQRYFYVIASGSGYISNASAQLTTNAYGMYTLPVTMRTAPTGSVVTGTNFYRFLANDLDDYVDSVYVNGQSPNNVIIGNGTQISNTQGRPGVFTAQNAACFVAASAEL